jgi:hypothetical protein
MIKQTDLRAPYIPTRTTLPSEHLQLAGIGMVVLNDLSCTVRLLRMLPLLTLDH